MVLLSETSLQLHKETFSSHWESLATYMAHKWTSQIAMVLFHVRPFRKQMCS